MNAYLKKKKDALTNMGKAAEVEEEEHYLLGQRRLAILRWYETWKSDEKNKELDQNDFIKLLPGIGTQMTRGSLRVLLSQARKDAKTRRLGV